MMKTYEEKGEREDVNRWSPVGVLKRTAESAGVGWESTGVEWESTGVGWELKGV